MEEKYKYEESIKKLPQDQREILMKNKEEEIRNNIHHPLFYFRRRAASNRDNR
jgi:hypothetical protein